MTSSHTPSAEDDFLGDLGGNNTYGFQIPAKKSFLPWHKPRKQFVREKQWCELIDSLITEHFPENKIVTYLGLPGDDLLDLRHFHDKICVPKGLKLRFLGFNKGIAPGPDHAEGLEISLDEINRLEYVDDRSILIPDDLTQIASDKSLAWEKSFDMGPFDVINIDLCDSVAKENIAEFETNHYNTLAKLMTLQTYRKQPWLLLLTTRTNEKSVNREVFNLLKGIYLDNVNKCNGFGEKSAQTISVKDEKTLDEYCEQEQGHSNIFLIGFAKWLLSIGIDQSPKSVVEIKNIMGYKVYPDSECPDMVSIALQINPIMSAKADRVGLSRAPSVEVDECSKAIEMLEKLATQLDVDDLLRSNTALNDLMIENTSTLLEQARYDIADYKEWARKQAAKLEKTVLIDASKNLSAVSNTADLNEGLFGRVQLAGPKVVGKINLDALDKYKRKN